ncbi:hypothetical protein I2H38_16655 [Microvirga sp. BT350]|uniref:HEPN domain-containing protein n=1 Tax=Microvirga alba TaxID=2791025 RepID=A0A931BPD1_9HYPH|nr:hypothetical protein [Microvirga alba]
MPLFELNHANRTIYFRKSISSPKFTTTSILTRDAWSYVELWLKRQRKQEALVYWYQARDFHAASKRLPPVSAPLTLYYCFMNAAKALLLAKSVSFSDRHGVSGQVAGSKRSLEAEVTELKSKGIVSDLAKYLKEPEQT